MSNRAPALSAPDQDELQRGCQRHPNGWPWNDPLAAGMVGDLTLDRKVCSHTLIFNWIYSGLPTRICGPGRRTPKPATVPRQCL